MFESLTYFLLFSLLITFIETNHQIDFHKENVCDRVVDIYETVVQPKLNEKNCNKSLKCVYTISIKPKRDDWLIYIRFTKFKIGHLNEDRSQCLFGFIQIIDGYQTNRSNSGQYCGEMDMPKTLISETPFVKIIFFVQNFNEDSYFQFSTEIQKQEEHWTKLGIYDKIESKSDELIENNFCNKLIQNFSASRCFIHSPGYPQVYPRNLTCRYSIDLKAGLIGLELITFEVDGEECESSIFCLPKPITTDPSKCLYDYIRIYDGLNLNSSIIITLCGRGNLKSSIISSSSKMLIEFVTSPAGRLMDTGFKLKIENLVFPQNFLSIKLSRNNSCQIKKTLSETIESIIFTNIRSWYPSNTTCFYIFKSPHTNDKILLKFHTFLIESVTLCEENLQIYDDSEANPKKLITVLCDTNRPRDKFESYISSGPYLYLQFLSKHGSFQGSSINYHFSVKRIKGEEKVSSNKISKNCSKIITPDHTLHGTFNLDLQQFNKSLDGPVKCNLTFDSSSLLHGRVNLSIYSAFDSFLFCGKYCDIGILGKNQPKLIIYRDSIFLNYKSPLCYCQPFSSPFDFEHQSSILDLKEINIISNSSTLILAIDLPQDWGQRSDSTPIKIFYRFFNEKRCGPQESFKSFHRLQGRVQFPFYKHFSTNSVQDLDQSKFLSNLEPSKFESIPLFCKWHIHVSPSFDISFTVKNLQLPLICSDSFLLVKDIPICESYQHSDQSLNHEDRSFYSSTHSNIIIKKEDIFEHAELNEIKINSFLTNDEKIVDIYFSSSHSELSSFELYWTQLKVLPETIESSELLTSISRECEFFCKSSRTCIHSSMVCNGFPNCPLISKTDEISEDENEAFCTKPHLLVAFFSNKIFIFGLVFVIFIFLLTITFFFIINRIFKNRQKGYFNSETT